MIYYNHLYLKLMKIYVIIYDDYIPFKFFLNSIFSIFICENSNGLLKTDKWKTNEKLFVSI